MNPMKSRYTQESTGHKIMTFIGILTMFLFVMIVYVSLDKKAPLGIKFDGLSFAMILFMFGFWFLMPGCIYFYRKRTKPDNVKLSDLEIDKQITVLLCVAVICLGLSTIFSYFVNITHFVSMLVVFAVILLFFFLQVKYRDKRRMNMVK